MKKTIGVRREDKNKWERRVPFDPAAVTEFQDTYGIETIIQPSKIRVFSDDEYMNAGALVSEDLRDADVIFAIKEIPSDMLEQGKTYLYFSHTIKGQPYNMEMLKILMRRKCNLIDYERVVGGENNSRLITFSRYAGIAGLIETLHAFGQKMKLAGCRTVFCELKQAYQYTSLQEAKDHLLAIGETIAKEGVPAELNPLTVGFLGYGNVSKGAQEVFDLLPFKTVDPVHLKQSMDSITADNHCLYKVVFKEEDIVKPRTGTFSIQDYYDNPGKYESVFADYLPYLKILINGIYWTEEYPRFVTRKDLKEHRELIQKSGVRVIGDISCDINGSIEITREATMPDRACSTYSIEDDSFKDGIRADGITVMSIDNLPCEFPADASISFSQELKGFVSAVATADFTMDFNEVKLPPEIKGAMILHKGCLTEDYEYMNRFL